MHWPPPIWPAKAPCLTCPRKVKDRATLLEYKAHLEAQGVEVLGVTDHGAFHSIYFFDPNGHRLELSYPDPDEAVIRFFPTTSGSPSATTDERPHWWPAALTCAGPGVRPLRPTTLRRACSPASASTTSSNSVWS